MGGTVLDETGAAHELSGIPDGRITVMAFVYMNCAEICRKAMPLLQDIHGLTSADPSLRHALQLVTLSFDPVQDTPVMMAMHGAALRPLLEAHSQPLGPRPASGEITSFEHQLRVLLIDQERRIRNI